RLAVATKSGEIKVWELNLNASRSDVYAANLSFGEYDKNASVGPILSLAFTADGQQLLCGGADHVAQLIDLRTGSVRAFRGHHGPIVSVAIPPKSDEGTRKIAVTGSRDRTCIVWDRETAQAICRLISLPNGDWFVVDSEGRFDANRLIYTDAPIAHWTFSDSPLATSDLALLQEHFFEPGLLPGALNSSRCEFADLPDLVDVNRAIPQVKIECVVPRDEHHADVYVRVGYGKHKVIRRGRKVTTTTKPYDLRLYRRGQLVGQFPPPKENPSSPMHDLDRWRKESDVLDGLEKQNGLQVDPAVLERLNNDLQGVVCFKGIALPTGKDGESWRMTAYAFNEEQMRSELATITARDASPREEIPTAYILSIGVDSYETPLRELNFAADDAIAFDREISKALQHMGHYQVVSVPLISARQKSHYASSANATKSNIEHVLKVLAGEPSKAQFPDLPQGLSVLKKATPDDVLIIFYAGHGFTASDGTFYVFPSNVGHRYLSLDGLLKSGHAISSHELSRWMQGVDVGRAALVVDACHSAGAVAPPGFKVGPFGSQGLGQLAYDKGIQVLAASQSNESAIEDQRFGGGHGLLTYTMLERLRQARQKFTLTDLFEYTRSNILLEYEEAKENRSSDRKVLVYDRAGDQISENQRGSGLPAVQEPALFDYQRRQDPIVLAPGEEASDRPSEQISNEVR
ncbi:MAG TPA: caspase family protein, partial [Pirellulaceae bacterium]|nr:caspase family protein [Pirellulaceae bacterium]